MNNVSVVVVKNAKSSRDILLAAGLEAVDSALNAQGGSSSTATVVEFFSRMHRTLQQRFVVMIIIPILKHLADDYATGFYDGRNVALAQLAAKMLAAVDEVDLNLPYI